MYSFLLVVVYSAVTVTTDGQNIGGQPTVRARECTVERTFRRILECIGYLSMGKSNRQFTVSASSGADYYAQNTFLPCSEDDKPSEVTGCKGLEFGKKYLISDKGGMLARCSECGSSLDNGYNQPVTTNGKRGDSFAQWTFEPVADGCLIKSDVERYLGTCYKCWWDAKYNQSLFSYVSSRDAKKVPFLQWKVEKHGGIKVAFKSDVGTYMTRCEDCLGQGKSNYTFVYSTTPEGPALWSVKCVNSTFPDFNFSLFSGY